jgi:hypothetical protein
MIPADPSRWGEWIARITGPVLAAETAASQTTEGETSPGPWGWSTRAQTAATAVRSAAMAADPEIALAFCLRDVLGQGYRSQQARELAERRVVRLRRRGGA